MQSTVQYKKLCITELDKVCAYRCFMLLTVCYLCCVVCIVLLSWPGFSFTTDHLNESW